MNYHGQQSKWLILQSGRCIAEMATVFFVFRRSQWLPHQEQQVKAELNNVAMHQLFL